MKHVLALDQGTTSSRSIVYDEQFNVRGAAQREFRQYYPRPGWVEHDAEEIWESQVATMREALEAAGIGAGDLAAVGITNQRESTMVWNAESGKPVGRVIVWQDRRTAARCARLRAEGRAAMIEERTGLRVDPYFSASKLEWLLDEAPGAREMAEEGALRFGTIDAWLIWRLTGGAAHVTDVTNASRTMLFDIRRLAWDDELLELFGVPRPVMPRVVDSSGVCGEWEGAPIAGVAGDQHAALMGQGCIEPGMAKSTYGTGCFLLMNTGRELIRSRHGLLTTVAWKIGEEVTYALEGSVFMGGAVFQWLRDELGVVESTSEVDALAASVPDSGGCVLVPAFAGLGAPHWDPFARGALFGVTRGTGRARLCRAAVEAVALQCADVLDCLSKDSGREFGELRVDGGAVRSDILLQVQADLLRRRVVRPRNVETTAAGAAMLAGLATGVWRREELGSDWEVDETFEPVLSPEKAGALRDLWQRAVERSAGWLKADSGSGC